MTRSSRRNSPSISAEPLGAPPAAVGVDRSPSYTKRTKLGDDNMSKLRFASMSSSSCDSTRSATYAVDPIRPASSAPQKAKRIRLRGFLFSPAIFSAISTSAAVPEPLSLMPGTLIDGVEVGADDDRALTGRPSSSRRSRCAGPSAWWWCSPRSGPDGPAGAGRRLLAGGEARHRRRDRRERRVDRTGERERLLTTGEAVVDDQDRVVARGGGVLTLSTKKQVPRTISAILPGPGSGKSAGLAAAGRGGPRRRPTGVVDRHDSAGHVTGAGELRDRVVVRRRSQVSG